MARIAIGQMNKPLKKNISCYQSVPCLGKQQVLLHLLPRSHVYMLRSQNFFTHTTSENFLVTQHAFVISEEKKKTGENVHQPLHCLRHIRTDLCQKPHYIPSSSNIQNIILRMIRSMTDSTLLTTVCPTNCSGIQ